MRFHKKLDNYQILRRIGRGAVAAVYEAQASEEERVAIKILHAEHVGDLDLNLRFLNEWTASQEVRHPAVIRVFRRGVDSEGCPYLVMELLGQSLAARCAQGPLALPEVCRVVKEIAAALAALHARDIIHRDVKPQNILFALPGDKHFVRLVDLGFAKLSPSLIRRLFVSTTASAVFGTPEYRAPEQACGSKAVSGPADVYSLGVVLYQLLSNHLPFDATDEADLTGMHLFDEPPPLPKGTPKQLWNLTRQMLAKSPSDRPTTTEVAAVLGS